MADSSISVAMKVAERIKSMGPAVEEAAVTIMVGRVLEKRTNAIVSVIDKIDSNERELRKLGPDVIGHDESGKKVSEQYSKDRIEARGKVNQQLGKLRKALDKALNEGDFGDVLNLANEKAN